MDYKNSETFGEFQLSYRTDGIYSPRVENTEPLFVEASHFIECVTTGATPLTDGPSGRLVVAALDAARASFDASALNSSERRGRVERRRKPRD